MGPTNFEKANKLIMDIISQLQLKKDDQLSCLFKVFKAFKEVDNHGLTEMVEQMESQL